ncbi:MAG: DUF1320 domain-containing protein [Methylococcaceae bacterium]
MAYCTQQDLIERFTEIELIQLTDVDNLGVINVTTVERALSDTDAEIDGYLAGRYNLPFVNPIATLNQKACDIARFYLQARQPTPNVQKRYEAVIHYFEQVAKGTIKLPIAATDTAQINTNEATMTSNKNVFGRRS